MGDTGLEHTTETTRKRGFPHAGGTESGTLDPTPALPPDLAGLIEAWATMPPAMRAGIAAMVQAAKDTGTQDAT